MTMANTHGEQFSLRWNDFEDNISSAFRELREDKEFFDVTLACEDNQIQAHKVILSACSPFFRSVLKRNPHQHPLLYLRGISYNSILAVLNFMYHGEVNVAQEELNSFLAVAEELKVKGLAQSEQQNARVENGESPTANKRTLDTTAEHEPLPRPVKLKKTSPEINSTGDKSGDTSGIKLEVPVIVEIDENEEEGQLVNSIIEQDYNADGGNDYYDCSFGQDYGAMPLFDNQQSFEGSSTGDLDFETFFSQNTAKMPGVKSVQCLICSKVLDEVWKMKNHFEAKHYHGQYKCPACELVFKTKNSLCMHRRRKAHY